MRIVKPSKTRRRNVAAVHDTNSPLAATYQYDKDSRRKKLGGRMAKTVIVTKFHSSAFKHASESALKKREFVREAVSNAGFTTGKDEHFPSSPSHVKEEKTKEGAA